VPAVGIPFGHFHLHRRLARGGMAEVFLARQRGLEGFDRRVAIKRILPHLSERADFVKMFLDEARLAARLSHPNIVHIYEFGKVDADYFIAMEYVDGVHAGQLIKRAAEEPLPPVLVARIGADAASALAHAHRLEDADGTPLQVVHRDISPQNLMISYDGVVKLVDFGIAKAAATAGDQTQPGVVKGKYAYMSPEQTVGKPLDGRSDVFSLALVLWEMLAGRYVVDRRDPVEAMRAIRDGRLPPIEQVVPGIPAPLAAALGHALAVDRDARATAAELGVALESFIKSAPEMATPLQLAEWIRARFPRSLTQSNPALAPLPDPPASTRPVTRATSIASVASPVGGTPAVALPPREATILHTAVPDATAAVPDLDLDLDDDDDVTTSASGRAPTHLPADDARTAMPRPPTAGAARRARPWLIAAILVIGGLAAAWAAGMFDRQPAPPPAVVRPGAGDADGLDAGAGTAVLALAADAATAPAALASLDVITSPPGASVRLAGRSATPRRSPASFLELEPGAVTVEVALKGHEPVVRELALAAGERRTIDLTLVEVPRPVARERRRGPATGTLNVRTTPYAVVYDGAKTLGETPFVKQLPAGAYTLRFVHPDHEAVTRRVVIEPGATTKLNFGL